jgi:hypothetical protein
MMDVVTVCHTPELHLLKLQARSIAQHLQPDDVGRLWVVLNEPVPGQARDYFDRHIAHEYGQFIDHVVVVERDELLRRVPVHRSRWGWRMQQVLKLRVACRIGSACYLILDAKNHFIRRVSVNSFFDGSTCFRSHSY